MVEAGGDEEGLEGLAAGEVAGAGERAEGCAVVGFLAGDEVCAGGLVLPDEVFDGEF